MTDQQQGSSLAQSVLGWLRAGYPDGIPPSDYIPILGVLQRRLTHDEIGSIAEGLAAQASATEEPISRDDIQRMVQETVYQEATDALLAEAARAGEPGALPS